MLSGSRMQCSDNLSSALVNVTSTILMVPAGKARTPPSLSTPIYVNWLRSSCEIYTENRVKESANTPHKPMLSFRYHEHWQIGMAPSLWRLAQRGKNLASHTQRTCARNDTCYMYSRKRERERKRKSSVARERDSSRHAPCTP